MSTIIVCFILIEVELPPFNVINQVGSYVLFHDIFLVLLMWCWDVSHAVGPRGCSYALGHVSPDPTNSSCGDTSTLVLLHQQRKAKRDT